MARRRRMTAARRRQIQLAQMASVRKRKAKRAKDSLGYWVAKGVNRAISTATFGASSALADFSENVKIHKRRKAREKAKSLKRRKGR